MFNRYFAVGFAVLLSAAPAAAQNPPREGPPAAFARAVQCRAIANPQERLACYDREVAALEQAERTSEIRVVDRQQVRNTRRTLFGLSLPDINIFGRDDEGEAVTEITSKLRSVSQDANGKYLFELEDGARWRQADTRNLVNPRPGQTIRIRRGSLGSFLANVGSQTAIRVRRVN